MTADLEPLEMVDAPHRQHMLRWVSRHENEVRCHTETDRDRMILGEPDKISLTRSGEALNLGINPGTLLPWHGAERANGWLRPSKPPREHHRRSAAISALTSS